MSSTMFRDVDDDRDIEKVSNQLDELQPPQNYQAPPGYGDSPGSIQDSGQTSRNRWISFPAFLCRRCARAAVKRRHVFLQMRSLLQYALMALGLYYLLTIISSLLGALCPEASDWISSKWHEHGDLNPEVYPIACHSHNDYWRPRPLLTALEYGCTAVEADVWLSDRGELLVGHSRDATSSNRTLQSLYIEPLLDILDHANPEQDLMTFRHDSFTGGLNGVFETAPSQSLVLLIDFKSNGLALWPKIIGDALSPLRQKNYLTHLNGDEVIHAPITIVVSGNAPFGKVISHPAHDIFFDAPLDLMSSLMPSTTTASSTSDRGEPEPAIPRITAIASDYSSPLTSLNLSAPDTYNCTNSYYASVSFLKSVGFPIHSSLSHQQLALMRAQIRGAHAQGLKVRYWGIPAWPIGVRNYLWRVMVREGVDYLSVDDVRAVAKDDWGPRKGGWGKKWWI